MKSVLIALGGNALLRNGDEATYESQYRRAFESFQGISRILSENEVVITHGNGPQVGNILLQNEYSNKITPSMPLHSCGSMSQGLIGEILANAYDSVRAISGISKEASVIITRTVVDKNDQAFQKPSKPIGPYYDLEVSKKLTKEHGWIMREENGKGYRRLVPSPKPMDILERNSIFGLLKDGFLPICVGGGGIPVVKTEKGFEGVDAVIDKDLGSSLIATILELEKFVILTDVDGVYVNYGQPDQKIIKHISADDAEKLVNSGALPSGSMAPKVMAAINFVRRGGKEAIIGSLDDAENVISGYSGTVVER